MLTILDNYIENPGKIEVFLAEKSFPPETFVEILAREKGNIEIYCWYEGIDGLPKKGATFMKKKIFAPLYERKKDITFSLYSLKGWDFQKIISQMQASNLARSINQINRVGLRCFSTSDFFQYCTTIKKGPLYAYISTKLSNKKWLCELSNNREDSGVTVGKLFQNEASLLDCLYEKDVISAYSQFQYVEGYYLIQRSVKEGLSKGKKRIQIVFALPNNEGDYYKDYPEEIKKMLRLDFGPRLKDITIDISFRFFKFKKTPKSRPYYLRKGQKEVQPKDIESYFDFLPKPTAKPALFSRKLKYIPCSRPSLPRDMYHNLNDW